MIYICENRVCVIVFYVVLLSLNQRLIIFQLYYYKCGLTSDRSSTNRHFETCFLCSTLMNLFITERSRNMF